MAFEVDGEGRVRQPALLSLDNVKSFYLLFAAVDHELVRSKLKGGLVWNTKAREKQRTCSLIVTVAEGIDQDLIDSGVLIGMRELLGVSLRRTNKSPFQHRDI